MNLFSLSLVLLVMCLDTTFGMTREQLKKTLTMPKKQCMPKTGATEEKVGRIEQGVFYEEKNVMCYVACIYKSIQVINDPSYRAYYYARHDKKHGYDAVFFPKADVTEMVLSNVKDEKLNKDMVSKQIDILYPADMKAAVKKSVAKCIDVQDNYNTECERVFYAVKCLYDDNPSNFIFP